MSRYQSANAYRASLISWSNPCLNELRVVAHTVSLDSEFHTGIHLIVKNLFLISVFVAGGKIL